MEGERKQVTVPFADLKGSMDLLADRDPEEARRLLDPVLERMMEAVHRDEGTDDGTRVDLRAQGVEAPLEVVAVTVRTIPAGAPKPRYSPPSDGSSPGCRHAAARPWHDEERRRAGRYLTPALRGLSPASLSASARWRKTGRIIPFPFPYLSGPRRLGRRRRDYRKAWAAACKAAGITERAPTTSRQDGRSEHGQRGTAGARDHEGHRAQDARRSTTTPIVSPADLQDVARRLTGTFGHLRGVTVAVLA
jgi:hypothetical protein